MDLFRFLILESQPGNESVFDIFPGTPEENVVWLEAVVGAGNARDRMEEIAERESSGHLFVYLPRGSACCLRNALELERVLRRIRPFADKCLNTAS